MKIVAHRGLWEKPEDKNTLDAMLAASKLGFEIETDVRDFLGELEVSHDPPTTSNLSFFDLLSALTQTNQETAIAVNVKSDGLSEKFKAIQEKHPLIKFYYFDMSGPEHHRYQALGLNCLVRVSEYEQQFTFSNEPSNYWVDSYKSDEYILDTVNLLQKVNKEIFIVSPELHGRPERALWNQLKSLKLKNNFHLCTDFPLQAAEFFSS